MCIAYIHVYLLFEYSSNNMSFFLTHPVSVVCIFSWNQNALNFILHTFAKNAVEHTFLFSQFFKVEKTFFPQSQLFAHTPWAKTWRSWTKSFVLQPTYVVRQCYQNFQGLIVNPLSFLNLRSFWNLTCTTRQGSRVNCLDQACFVVFGKEVQLVSGPPYAETEQLSRITSPSGIRATSWW